MKDFSYSIKNVRNLKDTKIDLRPITLLVGDNCSGRSSALHMLLLLKQSFESDAALQSDNPVEWNGPHIDCGGFEQMVSEYDTAKEMRTEFKIKDVVIPSSETPGESNRYDKISFEIAIGMDQGKIYRNTEIVSTPEADDAAKDDIALYMNSMIMDSTYIGPERITKLERSYPNIQFTEVKEISSDGSNLPDFLMSISDDEFSRFANWLQDLIKIRISRKIGNGAMSFHFRRGDVLLNLADIGMGIINILPAYAQLWLEMHRKATGTPKLVMIENPDAHASNHGKGRFAKAVAQTVSVQKKNKVDTVFLIECNTSIMINRIADEIDGPSGRRGRHSGDPLLTNYDFGVTRFELDHDKPCVNVENSILDWEGRLMNWPYGFLRSHSD